MFLILTRVLLWLLVLVLFFYIFVKIVPKAYFTFLGGLLLAVFIGLLLFDPGDRLATVAWSILSLPFKPVGIVWILLAQALQGIGKGVISKAATNQVRSAFLLLWFFSTPFLWQLVYHNSIERTAADLARITANDTAETLVLLARDTVEPRVGARPQIQLGDRGNTLTYAAQLYNTGAVNRIVVTGGERYDFPDPQADDTGTVESFETNEAQLAEELLTNLGVPETAVLVEDASSNLRSSALAVEELLEANGLDDSPVLLVAPALLIYRSAASFAQLDIDVIPRPTDYVAFVGDEGEEPRQLDFKLESVIPSVRGLELSTQLTDEYLATMYYFLRGWLSPTRVVCIQCREVD